MSTSDDVIGLPSSQILSNLHTVTCIVRLNCSSSSDPSGHSLNRQMSASMHDLYASISYKLLDLRPLALLSMKYRLRVPNESTLEVGPKNGSMSCRRLNCAAGCTDGAGGDAAQVRGGHDRDAADVADVVAAVNPKLSPVNLNLDPRA